jgi:DNA-binding transcriptional ArsR family regulator
MSLLPLRGESSADPDEPRVVGLAGEEADETFEVLSSGTTREVLAALYEQPRTPSEVRDQIDTSLQNAHYHLDKLEEADLIEPAGVGYSEKGTEMTVFAPTSEAVVLFAGRREDRSRFRSMLSRLFGVALALGVGTAAVRWFVQGQLGDAATERAESGGDTGAQGASDDGGAAGGDGGAATGGDAATATEGGDGVSIMGGEDDAATGAPEATEAAEATTGGVNASTRDGMETATETVRTTADAAGDATTIPQQAAQTLAGDPALAFLLGGVFALCVVGVVWYGTR